MCVSTSFMYGCACAAWLSYPSLAVCSPSRPAPRSPRVTGTSLTTHRAITVPLSRSLLLYAAYATRLTRLPLFGVLSAMRFSVRYHLPSLSSPLVPSLCTHGSAPFAFRCRASLFISPPFSRLLLHACRTQVPFGAVFTTRLSTWLGLPFHC